MFSSSTRVGGLMFMSVLIEYFSFIGHKIMKLKKWQWCFKICDHLFRTLDRCLVTGKFTDFPVCVIRNIFIRKLSHLTISSPFILINQKMHKKNHSSFWMDFCCYSLLLCTCLSALLSSSTWVFFGKYKC